MIHTNPQVYQGNVPVEFILTTILIVQHASVYALPSGVGIHTSVSEGPQCGVKGPQTP